MTDPVFYRILDWAFLTVHMSLVAFNLSGWAWRRTRRFHLVTIGATLLSWVVLGAVRGWGYCPLTDWHWRVKRARGEGPLPSSYVKYYLDRVTGFDWNPAVVDGLVVALAVTALTLSICANLRDSRRRRQAPE